jgi:hypothetical protein
LSRGGHCFSDDPNEYQEMKLKKGIYKGKYIDRIYLSNKEKIVEIKEMMFNIIAKIP